MNKILHGTLKKFCAFALAMLMVFNFVISNGVVTTKATASVAEDTGTTDESTNTDDGTAFEPSTAWYTSGPGEDGAYTLNNAADLAGFNVLLSSGTTFSGETIKLGTDITIDPDDYTWVATANEFQGIFDGQGKIISGINMNTTVHNTGMFGVLGEGAKIKDFTLTNSTFNFSNTSSAKNGLGAIAGNITGPAVEISNITCNVTIQETGGNAISNVGGLVGRVNADAGLTMTDCKFTGSITISGSYAGGMIGSVWHSSAEVSITGCTSTGTVSATGGYVGSIIGYANKGTAALYDYDDNVIGTTNSTCTVTYIGLTEPSKDWYTGDKDEYILMTAADLAGFQELRKDGTTFKDITIKLGANITINEGTAEDIKANGENNKYTWPGVASTNPFEGIFDGCDFTISGIYMSTTSSNKGMFGALGNGAEIKNFTLNNSYFVGTGIDKHSLGAIAGIVNADSEVTISNVTCNATLEGTDGFINIGGFIGQTNGDNSKINITDCTFGGNISTDGESAGGMIGRVSNKTTEVILTDCTSTGTITATNGKDGSIIGYANTGTIELKDYGVENDVIGEINTSNVTAKTLVIKYKPGTVNGSITSYIDPEGVVTIQLLSGDTVDYETTATDGTYSFTDVASGSYTMTVAKANHVTREYAVTIEGNTVTQDVKICPIGDVTQDGEVNILDVNRAYAHVNRTVPLTDYAFECGNVVGGNNIVNSTDLSRMYAHVKGTNSLWGTQSE